MFTTKQLDDMSQIALPEADRAALVDISSVHIDTTLPAAERMKSYLRQVKNPYLFRSGNTVVRVRFDPAGKDLGELLTRHFIGLKRG